MARKKLSKHLLEMKFMQRTGLHGGETSSAVDQVRIDDVHWVREMPITAQCDAPVIQQHSYVICEDLGFGRMSYNGFNPEIERIMAARQTESDLALAEEREREIGVDDQEMADRYSSLVGTIGNKFKSKKKRKAGAEDNGVVSNEQLQDNGTVNDSQSSIKRSKKHRTFMKPSDD